mgnify:CR=1 FL=1
MSEKEINSKVNELRELRRMADELAAAMNGITDSLKDYMDAHGVDTLNGFDWKITFKPVTSSRLDSAALRKALPDLAEKYTKTITSRRFCVA